MRYTAVIQRIRQILTEGSGASVQDGAAIAEAYAGHCKQANERLQGCADCLKRGMVSEALRIAETEPLLLDLCGELDFVGVEDWSNICGQRKWAKPEQINGKILHLLNEAYSSGQALEPLLKEYRRAVREHKIKECVRLLRQIATLDKANPNWLADLKGFEERRLTEIRREFEVARIAEDAETLASLMVEINADWKIPRDVALRDAVRDAARACYTRQAMVIGRIRLQEISKAYAAMDYDHLATAIKAYNALLHEGYLKPDVSMNTQFAEANEWLQQESKRRSDEQVQTETLGKLRTAVENGDAAPLNEILNILTRFDSPIPDRLEERAQTLIENHRLAMERVRKRKITIAALVMIIVAASITVFVSHQRHQTTKTQLLASLIKTYEAEDLENLKRLLANAEHDDPSVFRTPEIQSWVQKKTQLEALLEKKRFAFNQSLTKLESIREEGFTQCVEVVEGLIAESKANVTPGAAQGRLAAILRAWGSHNEAVQAEADRNASAKIDEFALVIEALIRNSNPSSPTAKGQYLSVREKGRKIEQSIEKDSPELKARLTALLSQLDALIGDLDSKERQLSMIRDARNLSEYLDALKTHSRAFPNDTLSKSLGVVLAQSSSYNQLLDLPSISTSNNPFWFNSNRHREEFSTRIQEKWPVIKSRLMDLGSEKRFIELWQCDTESGTIYFEGKPIRSFPKGVEPIYDGMVYIPKAQDIQPEFKQQTISEHVLRANLMPHCEFVQGLVSMARFSNQSKAYDDLVGEMQKLSANSKITPLLKLRIMDMLLGCLTDLVGEDLLPEWNALRRDIKSIDPELHWLCIQHRDVKLANEKADAIIKQYFSSATFINKSRFMSEIRDISLNRNVKWVAYAGLTDATQVIWKPGAHPDEIWVVRLSEGGKPQILLSAESSAKGLLQYLKYSPGEPLFAPTDGRSARTILSSLKQKYELQETKQLKNLNSWPANFCQ